MAIDQLIVLAGHGAGDPGAVGHGYQEAERVRALARRVDALGGDKVSLLDMDRNWYADKGLNTLAVPSGAAVIELHMDSSGSGNARGAHVIINSALAPDAYDKALASKLSAILPGRSDTIVKRSNLANCNICYKRGINYRLQEFGFIDNAADIKIFNERMDDIARAVLESFGLTAGSASSAPPVPPANSTITVDGWWGSATTSLLQRLRGTVIDGIVSSQYGGNRYCLPNTGSGWEFATRALGSRLIMSLQTLWGVASDGIMGPDTVRAIQRRYGVGQDGIMGPETVKALQRAANAGKL